MPREKRRLVVKLDIESGWKTQEPERRDVVVTREESLAYRKNCPYDAMGDYSVFFAEDKQKKENKGTGLSQTDISGRQIK